MVLNYLKILPRCICQYFSWFIIKIICFIIIRMTEAEAQKSLNDTISTENQQEILEQLLDTVFDLEGGKISISNLANNSLKYYRSIVPATKDTIFIKLGWRAFMVTPQVQDLVVACLSLFQSSIDFPFKVFISPFDYTQSQKQQRYLWIETNLHCTSIQETSQSRVQQKLINNFVNYQVIPIMTFFSDKYLKWSYMISQQYEDSKVLTKMQTEVIEILNNKINNLRRSVKNK